MNTGQHSTTNEVTAGFTGTLWGDTQQAREGKEAVMVHNLVFSQDGRKSFSEVQVGDLVTVVLAGGQQCGGRVVRIAPGTFFVKLVGLSIPQPYQLGDTLPISVERVLDWE